MKAFNKKRNRGIEMTKLKKQYRKTLLKRIWLNVFFYFPFIDVDRVLYKLEIAFYDVQCLKIRIEDIKSGKVNHDDTVTFYPRTRANMDCGKCSAFEECKRLF